MVSDGWALGSRASAGLGWADAGVDAILLDPHVDRRFAHPERHGELRNTRSGAREFDDLTTDL